MRRVSLLLAFVLLCSVLFACASAGEDGSAEATDSASTAELTDSQTASSTEEPVATLSPEDAALFASGEHLVGLTDQIHSRLLVCDLSVPDWSGDKAVVWSFRSEKCAGCDGIKFRHSEVWGGDVVIFCGSKGAGIVSYETKKLLYFTTQVADNPHSVELLPNGNLVVASSTGNEVRIYAAQEQKTVASSSLTFTSAHGVLWDPAASVLWVAGGDWVASYSVGGTAEVPQLGQEYLVRRGVSGGGVHDLAPVYGNTDLLWVTCSSGVYQVSKSEPKLDRTYAGSEAVGSLTYVPGVGNYPDGSVVFVTPNKTYKEWDTDRVTVFFPAENKPGKGFQRVSPRDAYYKCRVWIADYQ